MAAEAFAYNGTVPGPTIRVTEGDTIRVTVRNGLPQSTSIHWHGLHIANSMDGVPEVTQRAIAPGETFTYEFVASHAGTFMYHPHNNSVEQIDRGLYGLLIIDPQKPDRPRFDREFTMMLGAWTVGGSAEGQMGGMAGMAMGYNYFTINGKAFPATESWTVKKGDLVRVRIVNISNLAHPMHLHGQDFKVVARDGEPLPPALQQTLNTLNVSPGETYDIVFLANNPGTWVFHCHELHHTENNGVEPGGLIQLIRYEGASAALPAAARAPAAGVPVTPAPRPVDRVRIALVQAGKPVAAGEIDLLVDVTDQAGKPVRGAAVTIRYEMEGMGTGQTEAVETRAPGRYTARASLSMPGRWSVRVKVERAGIGREAQFGLDVTGHRGPRGTSDDGWIRRDGDPRSPRAAQGAGVTGGPYNE